VGVSQAIKIEALLYAREHLGVPDVTGAIFHMAYPSEFPLTCCGCIASEPLPEPAGTKPKASRVCLACRHMVDVAGLPVGRDNPHR
jgi:hypothetical protein